MILLTVRRIGSYINVSVSAQSLSTTELRNGELNLKGEMLDVNRAEPLEEVFKRIQFDKVDLQATFLDDEVGLPRSPALPTTAPPLI